MRVYLALVALSAGASAASVVEASTPAGVAETHAERELLTRSEAKTRQLERKLAKVKAKREKADAKVKKVEDALELPHSLSEAAAAELAANLEEEVAGATAGMFTQAQVEAAVATIQALPTCPPDSPVLRLEFGDAAVFRWDGPDLERDLQPFVRCEP